MSTKTSELNELIEVTRDGKRFYEHAREEVKDVQLKALFSDMAQAKTEVIAALEGKVAANNESPATGGTMGGKMRQMYADTRAALSSDEGATYIAQLEEAEDRILHAFEDAMDGHEPDLRAEVAAQMPKVRACHDRMRDLKKAQ
ncbi:MAG: PA2169 family four-helix-bundle protein [Halopseudomonas sp.]|uniref:ferritin-like domain-containing protein n=1 Tax=Halopseudomonas sp. TaxID=2901191 RepID=UPI0030018836